jgi:hemoglobin
MKKDIETREDIARLMDKFYSTLLQDPLMAPHFKDTDFAHHMPRIINFWSFILLDEPGFTGNVFDAHRHLNIDERHFERWIATFHATTDSLFEGKKAEYAKSQASIIGGGFMMKMKYLKLMDNG